MRNKRNTGNLVYFCAILILVLVMIFSGLPPGQPL